MTSDLRREIRRRRELHAPDGMADGWDERRLTERRRPVLIVSTDQDHLDLYVIAFDSAGVETRSAMASDDALTLVRDREVSAVVLDIVMPTDWDTCAMLARVGADEVPLIALTGWLSEDGMSQRRAFALGCAAFVAKPVLPEHLQRVVEHARAGGRRIMCVSASSGIEFAT